MLLLNGWGQPCNTLNTWMPQATAFDYAQLPPLHHALHCVAREAQRHEVAIGWSLGGQLLVRAIAAKLFRPRKLVLIAAPFQFVETPALKLGMKRDQYEKFCENYGKNPSRTLQKAQALIGKGDSKAETLREQFPLQESGQDVDWLYWLRALDSNCSELDFSHFPPTLLLHGEEDVVVSAAQSVYFHERLPDAELSLWPGCGHAPHWHDPKRARYLTEAFIHV